MDHGYDPSRAGAPDSMGTHAEIITHKPASRGRGFVFGLGLDFVVAVLDSPPIERFLRSKQFCRVNVMRLRQID